MKTITLLTLILLTAYCILLTGTIRYVSKTGSATPPYISWATAADSIQKCINICQNGDTVYVGNGVYNETIVIYRQIALIGSSMDSTIIDQIGLPINNTIETIANCSISNFTLKGKGAINQYSTCIYNHYGSIYVSSCKISDAYDGIGISANCSVYDCFISNVYDAGIFSLGTAYIRNSIIFVNNTQAHGIYFEFGTYTIRNNIIITTNSVYDGIFGGDSPVGRVEIKNNLIAGFKTSNIRLYSRQTTNQSQVHSNNLSYLKFANHSLACLWIATSFLADVRNNTFIKNEHEAFRYGNLVTNNHNLFFNNEVNSIQALGAHNVFSDPMFVNDTLPTLNGKYDFHLQEFSPAIDSGDPNIYDVDGTRSDIGMYGGPFGEITYYKDFAPKPPRNLSVIVDTNKITLRWNKNTEADTAYYKIYRDNVQNFIIDSTNLIGTTTDTFYVHSLIPIGRYFYKLTCIDNQDNESNPSEEIVVNITSINDYPMTINDYFLYQNYPNPFNSSTTIGYKLKERGYVKLMVYDIKGELVSVLVNQEQEAGYYEAVFDTHVGSLQSTVSNKNNIASGIYLYRIEVIGEGNIPVYTDMKKMLLIK